MPLISVVAIGICMELLLNFSVDSLTICLTRQKPSSKSKRDLYVDTSVDSEINFSSGAVCLVLTSHEYTAEDYIRDYDEYLDYINDKK